MALSSVIFADTSSAHSAVLRVAERSFAVRWSGEVGAGLRPGEVPPLGPIVDQMVGSLPLPPRSMRVVRGNDLRNLAPGPDAQAEGPYYRRLRHLAREIRVFAACNFVLFLATALLTFKRRSDARPVLVPASLLMLGALASIAVSFVARDWFWSFLADDYARVSYLSLVGVVALSIVDILVNGARVVGLVLRFFSSLPA